MKLSSFAKPGTTLLASAFVIYLLTLAPTVQSFDSAELTVGAHTLGFVHAPGYPLYMLLGYVFGHLPFGDVGLRLNLMSAVFAALAVLVLSRTAHRDLRHSILTVPAMLLFATTPVFWSQALRAEVYTLHVFLLASVLYLWRRAHQSDRQQWYIVCFTLLGLGLGNHVTILLLWGSVLSLWLWESPQFRWAAVAGSALGVVIAGTLYLYFPLRSNASPAIDYIGTYFDVDLGSPAGLWWLFSSRMFQHAFYLDQDLRVVANELLRFGTLLWEGFLGVGGLLGMWGWWRLRKREVLWNRLLTIFFVANAMAFALYHVVDKEVMFIPAFAVWSIWVAHGLEELVDWIQLHFPNLSAGALTTITSITILMVVGVSVVLNWDSVSLHTNRRAYEFAGQLMEEARPSAIVVNGWVTASVLDYLQLVEGRRPDVQSFNLDFYNLALQERHGSLTGAPAQVEWHGWLARQLEQRPVCFVEPLPAVPAHYNWVRNGLCWELD